MQSATAAVKLPGIVVALPLEARSLGVRAARRGNCLRVNAGWVALAGMGMDNARLAAERLISHDVCCLLSWGIAGGLVPILRPGDLLLPERIVRSEDGMNWESDPVLREHLSAAFSAHLNVQRGVLWSGEHPVLSSADKHALANHYEVAAVDMESAAVASVAARAHLPFLAVKAICDPFERNVPPRAANLITNDGRVSLPALVRAVFSGPVMWRALAVLRRDFAVAQCSLASAAMVLPAVLPA